MGACRDPPPATPSVQVGHLETGVSGQAPGEQPSTTRTDKLTPDVTAASSPQHPSGLPAVRSQQGGDRCSQAQCHVQAWASPHLHPPLVTPQIAPGTLQPQGQLAPSPPPAPRAPSHSRGCTGGRGAVAARGCCLAVESFQPQTPPGIWSRSCCPRPAAAGGQAEGVTYLLLTISPSRTTFSPLTTKMPRGMSPYFLPTWIRSTVWCSTKFAAAMKRKKPSPQRASRLGRATPGSEPSGLRGRGSRLCPGAGGGRGRPRCRRLWGRGPGRLPVGTAVEGRDSGGRPALRGAPQSPGPQQPGVARAGREGRGDPAAGSPGRVRER